MLVKVASSAGDLNGIGSKGVVTRRELLVVRWLAVEGRVDSPGFRPPVVEMREQETGANFVKMTSIAEVGVLELR